MTVTDPAAKAALADLERIGRLVDVAKEERRWCDGLGYIRRKRTDMGSGSAAGVSDVGDTLCTCSTRAEAGEPPPICGPCTARTQVAAADKMVTEARALLAGALRLYGRALTSTDRGHAPRPAEFRVTTARAVSKAEMTQAKKAQAKRRARGEL